MKQQTFIFIGRSGSGKGTQADLLEEYLKKNDSEKRDVYHIITGNFLREFAKGDNHSAKIVGEVLSKGLLMPDFVPVVMWGNFFLNNLKGKEHIITDGMPRKIHEAMMLDGAFKFYNRGKPIVIFIELSYKSAVERLLLRKRADDTKEAIEERLKFYDTEVKPVIDYYKNNHDYVFLNIDGEPTIEEIHKDIVTKLENMWLSE